MINSSRIETMLNSPDRLEKKYIERANNPPRINPEINPLLKFVLGTSFQKM
jgi:hypothetical protein